MIGLLLLVPLLLAFVVVLSCCAVSGRCSRWEDDRRGR